MAACLITISGTSGILELKYNIGANPYSIRTSLGTLYIEDTATSVTYTRLSGDVVAASLCLTITSLPANYYKLSWKGICTDQYIINAVALGLTETTLPNTMFPISMQTLIDNVNNSSIPEFKIVGYKYVFNPIMDLEDVEISYIARVLGTNIPYLKVRNSDSTTNIYIKGVTSVALPAGFTAVEVCEIDIPSV